ncbi:MAG: Hpt domain-containing protein [Christensenellales bacterium]|jgi:HPt (histidine-containing phosphotransfer) domain-containing protein
MADFRERFEAYGGDYEATMGRFMGNEALYRRLLPMLFEDDSFSKLKAALIAGDLEGAFQAAHTLKGVTGNLGLTPLYAAICQIVEPLRRRDPDADYPAMSQAIADEFDKVARLRRQLEEG